MKPNISFICRGVMLSVAIIFLMLVATQQVKSQATCSTPSNIANFGVDGDVKANTPSAIMGDSWFYSNVYPGTGIGVIGTTAATAVPPISAAAFKSIIQSATSPQGRNRTYAQRMSVPPLSLVNGMTLIDAFSARDNISPDSTAFTGSNKNGDNPSVWSVGLSSVPNKNDIIDVGGHLRRQTTGTASLNDLWMYTYVTRLATGGDAYTDIEIYRTVPYLNTATGKLMNTGPAATGGHTAFTFNSSAGIANPGDIILCVNYNSSGGVASVRIWCNINNLNGNNNGIAWFNAQPGRPFNFTGDFITGTNANGYGYAEIQSLSGASCLISSVLNSANTPAGEWGNLTGSGAVFDTNIEPEQLVNIAFNFTDMGLDFAFLAGPCYNVFGALWFKTRSSSSYSSELKDACGPFTFGNFSEIQANAGPDKSLTCTISQTTLNGSSATQGAIINWTTPNGNIVSGANTTTPVVNAAGMYIISAQNPGLSSCIATDTVFVTNDVTVPNANAGPDKQITCSSPTISLSGSSSTPGTQFSWVAISGGNIVSGSNSATPVVNAAGCYVLTVSNPSNGCTRTDTSCVSMNMGIPVISNVSQVNVNCYSVCTGSLNLSVSGGQAPYTYIWNTGATTASLSNLCAGTYTVTVSGSNGCTTTANYAITQPGATLAASVNGVTNVACFGQSSGAINLNVTGGTSPYSYSWSNGAISQDLNGIASGIYSVTVTDANGCTAVVAAITVASPVAGLAASLSAVSNVSCFNGNDGSIALSVNGGTTPYSYSWSNGATSQNINNLTTGTYSVTVTDNNGCTVFLSSVISQPSAALVSNISSSQNVSCFGGNNGALNLSVSGGTSPYTYVWNNGATTQDIVNLTSGTYAVTVTDAQGCTSVSTATITQPASALSASINASQNISCYSGNNGSIDLNVQGGTAPYTYSWSNGAATQDISGLGAGVYTVNVTDSKGCVTSQTITLTEPAAALSGTAVVTQQVSCFGGTNGSINLSVSGGTAPYNFVWSNGSSSEDLSGLVSGAYSVTITDAKGCTISRSATITQPSASLSATASQTQAVSCNSGNDGQISLVVSGGTAPYSFNWSNGASTQSISNLVAATYTVTVTDLNGCTDISSATITQPVLALSGSTTTTSNISCFSGNNGSIDLTVAGGTAPYIYNWSTGAGTQDLTGLSAGTYSVTITDANGCTAAAAGTISQPAGALSTNINISQNIPCYGGGSGSINLSVSGGTTPYFYSWSNGATSQDISGLSAGTYTVTITDANGCNTSASATITQPSAPLNASISSVQPVLCFGGTNGSLDLTVTGGTFPYDYSWSNGQTTQQILNLTAGIYTVTVTDANGCTTTKSGTITQPAAALSTTAVITQQVSCYGGNNGAVNVTTTGGTAPYNFTWSNGSTTEDLNGLSAGSYTLNIVDANGCAATRTISITQPVAALNTNASSVQQVSCYGGNNGAATVVATGGTAPYVYLWSNGGVTQNINALSTGIYSVTVTDANGCTEISTVAINQPNAALSAVASISQQVSCFGGSNGSLTLSVSGGTVPYTFLWSNGAVSQNLNNVVSGTYTVTITDANGCSANQTKTISQPAAALNGSASVSQNVSCFGGSNGSIVLNVTGGTLPYSYSWNTGASTQNLNGLSSGTYTVAITDFNGCTAASSATIIQPVAGLALSSGTIANVSCFGGTNGSINITANGGTSPYTYAWSNGAVTQNISGLGSGTYTVTVTDANGCTASQTNGITQPVAALNLTIANIQPVLCFNGNSGGINVTVSGGTAPYLYNWSNGASSQNLSGIASGNYTLTVTDANGCTDIQSVNITQPAAALNSVLAVSQNVSCFGGNNGAMTLSVSGGTAPYTYLWNTGAFTQNISGLTSGTYTVTITDVNGCTTNSSATISQPNASLSSLISVGQNVSCFGGNNGSINLSVNGGTSPYSFAWNTGSVTQNITGLISGNYSVTVTDANGCTTANSANVGQPNEGLSAGISINQNVSCFGGNNGSVDLFVSGGTAPYTYFWSNGATTQDISSLVSGTYTVTITDANGCTQQQSGSVSQPSAALSASGVAAQSVSCFGGSNGAINLTVNGGTSPYTFVWSNGITTQNMGSLSVGTYTVTVTDANGCIANTSVTVTQPAAALSTTITSSQNVNCFGGNTGSVNLTVANGTAPYTYNWSNGATTQDLSGLGAGTYSVTVTDANGCVSIQTVTITQPTAALASSATIDQNVSCFGGSNGSVNLTVTGGTTPYTYNWSNGQTTQDMSGLGAGNYTVTVTDVHGCTTTRTITISQPAAALSATASQSQAVSCNAGSDGQITLAVSGGTSPYTYVWSNGQTTQAINGLTAGTYTVTVTDANGCTKVASATITQPANALSGSTTTTSNISCFSGNNGSIDLTVAGGTAPYTYMWSNGAITQDLNGLPAGSYSVTITDANGCVATSSGIITQPAGSLAANLSVSQNVNCFGGGNGALDLTVSGGTTPYTYNWSTGATTEDVSGLAVGFYTVSITDANGCISSATGSITQPSAALSSTISTSQNVNCFGGNNGSLDLTVSGGTLPYSYNWSNGATSQDINNLVTGNYTVTITDANGCTTIQTGSVSQPAAALNATASASANVSCYGGGNGSANLTVTGGTAPYSYSWSNGQTTEDISGLSAGSYTVNITDANGCNTTASVTITEPSAAVSITINSTTAVSCFGGNDGQAAITANGGTAPYTYLWNTGATTAAVSGLSTGTYTVTVTDINGCSESTTVTLSQPVAPVGASVSVGQNVSCFGGNDGTADLTVNGGTSPYTYIWNTGATTEDVFGLSSGTYTVTVTDFNNCITSQTITVSQPAAALSGSAVVTGNISCFSGNNGSIDLTAAGGTAPYSFQWSTGAVTEDVNGLGAGMYTVTITDANGCTTITNAEITQPAGSLVAVVSVNQNVLCFAGNSGSLDLTVSFGTAPYVYLWNTGATSEDISGLTSGIYTVTVTDANGCFTSQSAFVAQPSAALNAQAASVQAVLCYAGTNGSVDINVTGGTTPYSFIWSNGAVSEDISNLSVGTYTVTITDVNGCTFTLSETISQPAAALTSNVNASQNVNCFGGNNGSVDLNVNGGTMPYSFVWNTGDITEDIANLFAGIYSVTITDVNGCTNTAVATITQPNASLTTSISGTINVLCFGGSNGNINLDVTGGTAPYNYIWSNGEITEDISGLIAGTYSVSITDANGCTSNASATISEPSAALNPVVSVLQNINCFGDETGVLDLTVTGGTTPYTYVWSNGATTEDLSLLFAGIYTVTVTDANGCTETGQASITQPSAPLITNVNIISNVFCNGGATGSLDLIVNGGTAPYTYLWNNGLTTEDISNLVTGTYTVTTTDANGCTSIATAAIGQPSQQLSAAVTIQNVLCFNGNNGVINITPSGGTSPYSYIWNTGAVTEDIGGLVAGTYTVSISDANGCDTVITASVIQPAAPLIPALTIAQNVSCYGGNDGSITLSVTGGTLPYVYLWSNGSTTTGISGLPSGAYTVTITDANGCNAIISDFVSQPAAPLETPLNVSQQVSCFGGSDGSLTTNATGGTAPYSYLWNTGATTSGLTGLPIGTYTVTVTDANGCTYIASTQVTQPNAPLAVTGTTTIANCLNGQGGTITIQVTGGTPAYSYLWSNGATTQNIANAMPGPYTVTVTDANGCSVTGTYIVDNYSDFNISAGPTTICIGEFATLMAEAIPGATYQWYFQGNVLNGATGLTFNTPAAGYYYVTATVPCGTFYSDSIEVIVKSIENASISSNRIICPPETVQLLATGGVTYEWSPTNFMTFSNVPDPIVNPPVSTTYSVLVTNEWGCKITMSVDIAVACDTLFIPNGFSPNDDGTNDGFVIDGIENYPGNKLWVYNRWGNMVFKTKDYDNNWDGVSNVSGIYIGKKVPTGTYYFILDLNDNSKPRAGYLIIRR